MIRRNDVIRRELLLGREELTVAEVTENGTRIRMLDGSEWRIEGAGVDVSTGWLPGDDVIVRGDGKSCEMVNGDETVRAERLG